MSFSQRGPTAALKLIGEKFLRKTSAASSETMRDYAMGHPRQFNVTGSWLGTQLARKLEQRNQDTVDDDDAHTYPY
jgi:hypothetical protein